jgi:cobalt-precorrin-7 (C5)-methyltransferase
MQQVVSEEGVQMKGITVVGCGPGSRLHATGSALQAIEQADMLIGARRLLDEFGKGKRSIPYRSVDDTLAILHTNKNEDVAVLVTGDPGFFSITACIIREFGSENVNVVPGISSMTYAFDRLGLSWHDAVFISAHKAMPEDFSAVVTASDKLGILTSPSHTPAILVSAIDVDVAAPRCFYVGENLSYPNENLGEYSYEQTCAMEAAELSVLIIVRREKR